MNIQALMAATALGLPLALPAPARAAVFCDGRVATENVMATPAGQVTRYEVFVRNLTGQGLRATVTVTVPWAFPGIQPTPSTHMIGGGDRHPFVFASARHTGGGRVPTAAEVSGILSLSCAGR